jgi:hypothetical protein
MIFGSTNQFFCGEFRKIMTDRFEMLMMRELKFFLEFQIKQLKDVTFLNQTKYTRDILNKFGMNKAKHIKTLMGTNGHLDLNMGGKLVDQKVYRSIIGSEGPRRQPEGGEQKPNKNSFMRTRPMTHVQNPKQKLLKK